MALTKVSRGLLSTSIVDNGNATAITIDSSENVGIGTSSPVSFGANTHGLTINGTGNYQHLTLQNNGNSDFSIYTNGSSGTIINQESADPLIFNTSGAERMRIDSSGNVGIGQSNPTSPNDATDFIHIGSATNQDTSIVLQDAVETWEIYQNDDLSFLFDTTNVMTLQRLTGFVGLGTSSPAAELHINDAIGLSRIRLSGGADGADNFEFGQGTSGVTNAGFEIRDVDAAATRLVIDSSGNLLVGKTSTSYAVEGIALRAGNAGVMSTVTDESPFTANRLNSDGRLFLFAKDTTTVGSIGTSYWRAIHC